MIQRSTSFDRRIARELVRQAGSQSLLVYYDGAIPATCDAPAEGERVATLTPLDEQFLRNLAEGVEPPMADGANYWRLLDNGGLVVMQGDGTS